jgi:flagellar biogenesis protein FliO
MILDSLSVLLFGMAGIFVAMGLIAFTVWLLNKLGTRLSRDKSK